MENPIKMDDLGVPPFKETPIWTLKVRFFLCEDQGVISPPSRGILPIGNLPQFWEATGSTGLFLQNLRHDL